MNPDANIPPFQPCGPSTGLELAGHSPGSATPLELALRIFTQPASHLPGRHLDERAHTPHLSPIPEEERWQK